MERSDDMKKSSYKPARYFDNARLAVDLAVELGANGTSAGTMSAFSETPPDWFCPGCGRYKQDIARLTRSGEFYCAFHLHHDHSIEEIADGLGVYWLSDEIYPTLKSWSRFDDTYVCMDCNRIDSQAKRIVSAPKHFSFSAEEIYKFARVERRQSHKVNDACLQKVFDQALRQHKSRVFDAIRCIKSYTPDMVAAGKR